MEADTVKWVDVGYHKVGLFVLRFSRCTGCGEEFPHATKLESNGYVETPSLMCNGEPVAVCHCEDRR